MYPRTIGHVGLTVVDIEKSVKWFCDVFGFTILTPIEEIAVNDESIGSVNAREMLGDDVRRFKIARICDGSGTALEFFQYLEIDGSDISRRTMNVRDPGWVHICITDEDIEGLKQRVQEHGGTCTRAIGEGENTPYKTCYCRAPDGIVIELATHSSERMYSNQ